MADAPVFLFPVAPGAGGWRMQHALSASRQALVWRAAPGSLNHFLEGVRQIDMAASRPMDSLLNDSARKSRKVLKPGDDVLPYVGSLKLPGKHARRCFRSLLNSLYGGPSRSHGFPAWGVYDATADKMTADMLKLIYPDSKFVFLVRHPLDSLGAAKASRQPARDRWGERPAAHSVWDWQAREWGRKAAEFAGLEYGHCLRYEDWLASEVARRDLNAYLGFEVPGPGEGEPVAPEPGREKLSAGAAGRMWPAVAEAAALWGYAPESGAVPG